MFETSLVGTGRMRRDIYCGRNKRIPELAAKTSIKIETEPELKLGVIVAKSLTIVPAVTADLRSSTIK